MNVPINHLTRRGAIAMLAMPLLLSALGGTARANAVPNYADWFGYGDEAATLAIVMPQALEACECKFNALEAKVLHFWAGGRRAHPGMYAAGVRLALAGDKPRRAVAASADMDWRSAYPRVLSAAASAHPQVLTLAGGPQPKAGVIVPLRRACNKR